MSTLGIRGLLAGVFVLSLGLLTGASHGATGLAVSGEAWGDYAAGPSLLDRAQAKACEWSQGLSGRSDRLSADQRQRECARRHGLAD
ncbi:hypothetical protein [Arenimonas sp.]|uniref:hypothetical protein n=1 Tax=Arenimonas sp. TaxID=1872635 RepID=UPI0035B22114